MMEPEDPRIDVPLNYRLLELGWTAAQMEAALEEYRNGLPDGAGDCDVFVHRTVLKKARLKALEVGQRVIYETHVNPNSGKPAVAKICLAFE